MWPLSLVLLFATAAPQQNQSYEFKPDLSKLKIQVQHMGPYQLQRKFVDAQRADAQKDLCYAIRSYYFQRQDGQAPVLVGTATCTPADKLQQRQVSPNPGTLYVPLGLQTSGQK